MRSIVTFWRFWRSPQGIWPSPLGAITMGLCLSSAAHGSEGARLPLVGKADVGKSAEGFVRLIQEAAAQFHLNSDIKQAGGVLLRHRERHGELEAVRSHSERQHGDRRGRRAEIDVRGR